VRLEICIGLAACVIVSSEANCAELSKSEAGLILTFMGCNPSRVAAVVNGVGPAGFLGGTSSGNTAQVIATCLRNGKPAAEEYFFLYDTDLGWFYYEKNQTANQIRLWTKSGYKQIDSPQPPAPR
jgi:hypothetical protein